MGDDIQLFFFPNNLMSFFVNTRELLPISYCIFLSIGPPNNILSSFAILCCVYSGVDTGFRKGGVHVTVKY